MIRWRPRANHILDGLVNFFPLPDYVAEITALGAFMLLDWKHSYVSRVGSAVPEPVSQASPRLEKRLPEVERQDCSFKLERKGA